MNRKRLFKIPKIAAWIYPRRLWYGEKENVYLTFDDGPHPEITPWLLGELKKLELSATFFWTGENIQNNPTFLERALKEGHAVGHHGYRHISGKELTLEAFKENYNRSKALVNSKLFRPPYGDLNRKQAKFALKNGKLVMWSWMSYDFDDGLSNKVLLDHVKKEVKGGDILVFHENDKTKDRIKEVLAEVVEIIQAKDLKFDTIR